MIAGVLPAQGVMAKLDNITIEELPPSPTTPEYSIGATNLPYDLAAA
jgi:hypothetical protein